ncbi:MAG TPA: NAD(P)-dependent oxidoreductase [Planctomycetaceae bacterium]
MSGTTGGDRPWVLITGIGGLLGTKFAEALYPAYRIIGIDRKEEDNLPTHVPYDYLAVDLTSDGDTARVLAEVRERTAGRLASVIHLAAYYDFAGEPSPLYETLTVQGTRRLLRGLLTFESVEQFVFSSSLLVMKPNNAPGKIDENSPVEGKWAYPESKIRAEEVIREEHDGIPAVILRIAGVYDERGHSLPLGQQIGRIYEKRLEGYFYPGDSSRGQALVHLDDLADLCRRVVDRRGDLGEYEVFLVAEPDVMSYGELQDRLGELIHGDEWPTVRVPKLVAKAGAYVKDKLAELTDDERPFIKPWMIDLADDHYEADVTKARTKLGWEPRRRLRDTLPAIVESLKRDPVTFYKENYLPVTEEVERRAGRT